jgi:hypothetical protein
MSRARTSLIGLPASRVSVTASSSAWASIRSAKRMRTFLRSVGERFAQTPALKLRRAAATAASTSAGPQDATSASGCPVAGFSVT